MIFENLQFIPPWGMPVMLIGVIIYNIIIDNKINIIKRDLTNPKFILMLLLVLLFLFFVKDKNEERSQKANDHAIIAGIGAYFGHLDMPLVAFFLTGTYTYYTYKKIKNTKQ